MKILKQGVEIMKPEGGRGWGVEQWAQMKFPESEKPG
jgi:hypothetical protein